MENENPSYFAIIPADVRYDKRLKANEKLMYGEITCLANKLGYCFSTNNYFAELYDVTPQAISGWIKNLEKCGYITCEYLHNGTEIKERRIRIVKDTNSTNNEEGNSTKLEKGINKSLKGYKQKFKDNNTSSNNTSTKVKKQNTKSVHSNITKSDNGTSQKVIIEPTKKGDCLNTDINTDINNKAGKKPAGDFKLLYDHYLENHKKLYNQGKLQTEKVYISYKKNTVLLKRLLTKFSVAEISLVLDRAMNDMFCLNTGYALSPILSDSVFSRLLNAIPAGKNAQTKEQYTDEEYMRGANFVEGVY